MLEREKVVDEGVVVSFASTGSAGSWYSPFPTVGVESRERLAEISLLNQASLGCSAESKELLKALLEVLHTLEGSGQGWFDDWHIGSDEHPALVPETEEIFVPFTHAGDQVVTLRASVSRVEAGDGKLGLTDEDWNRLRS